MKDSGVKNIQYDTKTARAMRKVAERESYNQEDVALLKAQGFGKCGGCFDILMMEEDVKCVYSFLKYDLDFLMLIQD